MFETLMQGVIGCTLALITRATYEPLRESNLDCVRATVFCVVQSHGFASRNIAL